MKERMPDGVHGRAARVHLAFFGSRVQKMIEKVSPAKNVDAARAVLPMRRLRIADAVQQHMITAIKTKIRMRLRPGVSMA